MFNNKRLLHHAKFTAPIIILIAFIVLAALARTIQQLSWTRCKSTVAGLDGRVISTARVYEFKHSLAFIIDIQLPHKRQISYVNLERKFQGLSYPSDLRIETPGFVIPKHNPPTVDVMPDEAFDLPAPQFAFSGDFVAFQSAMGHVKVSGIRSFQAKARGSH